MRSIFRLGVAGAWLGMSLMHCGGATQGPGGPADASDATSPRDAGSPPGDAACSPDCIGIYNNFGGTYRACCNGACVNPTNDPFNCGGCGITCSGAASYCNDGKCEVPPCAVDGGTPAGETCCGMTDCGTGQLCCTLEGPVATAFPMCFTTTASNPSCPLGCSPTCVSDRNVKRDVVPVDPHDVLDALDRVPMSTWSYKTDDPSVRHLGPMAQDLHAAFGLGSTDKSYDPIDAHGVAFASIQALYRMIKKQNARIERLEGENAKLRQLRDGDTKGAGR